MSISHVGEVVREFVTSTDSSIVVIKGAWGVGKTYFWQQLVQEGRKGKTIRKSFYSYISLFGLSSLEDLKNAIVATREDTSISRASSAKQTAFKVAALAEKIPGIKEYTEGIANQLIFQTVRNGLICIDDIERKSDGLTITEILGLASVLKEQRQCQVVFILNEGAFSSEDAQQLSLYREKTVDIELEYSPITDEVLRHVYSENDPNFALIRICILELGIKNIRLIQRIKRQIDGLMRFLVESEQEVIDNIIKNLILFSWLYFSKDWSEPLGLDHG